MLNILKRLFSSKRLNENYLQRAWSDGVDNIDIREVDKAIQEVQQMDDEHGAFWVGLLKEDEIVLEVSKDLSIVGIFNGDLGGEIKSKAKDWQEVRLMYKHFLDDDLEAVKSVLLKNKIN